jgi:hypothetical protein
MLVVYTTAKGHKSAINKASDQAIALTAARQNSLPKN